MSQPSGPMRRRMKSRPRPGSLIRAGAWKIRGSSIRPLKASSLIRVRPDSESHARSLSPRSRREAMK